MKIGVVETRIENLREKSNQYYTAAVIGGSLAVLNVVAAVSPYEIPDEARTGAGIVGAFATGVAMIGALGYVSRQNEAAQLEAAILPYKLEEPN
jgi:hypothetical protein